MEKNPLRMNIKRINKLIRPVPHGYTLVQGMVIDLQFRTGPISQSLMIPAREAKEAWQICPDSQVQSSKKGNPKAHSWGTRPEEEGRGLLQ